MRKFLASILGAMLLTGMLSVPAFADESVSTRVEIPDMPPTEVPVTCTDTELLDGSHLIEATAPDEEQAVSAVCKRIAEVDPDGKALFGEWKSGTVEDKYEVIVIIDEPGYTETVHHDQVTHEETIVDEDAWDETVKHDAITHDETVVDEEAWDETIEHPAVTHEETVVDKEAWDEQVCTPGTDPYGYKVEGDNRDGFTVEEGAFILIKQASEYVIIWSEDAEFSDYPTAKEIAAAAKDGSIKNQQVIKWKGLGEFYPGNLGQPWHHWYGFCKNSEGVYFWVDNINGISHADVYVPGKPGECIEVHHGRIVHYETVVDEEAWTETIHHDAVTHEETVVDVPAWEEVIHHEAITHTETVIDKAAWDELIEHKPVTHEANLLVAKGYGWANVPYLFPLDPEDPDDPVVPDDPDNPDPISPDPTPDPSDPGSEDAQVVDGYHLPKTADNLELVGYAIALACVVAIALALCSYNAKRYDEELNRKDN